VWAVRVFGDLGSGVLGEEGMGERARKHQGRVKRAIQFAIIDASCSRHSLCQFSPS